LNPSSIFYYLEYQDELKNPSWKRRMHRFYPTVDIETVEELNQLRLLAELSYADTFEEIRQGLEKWSSPCSLIFTKVTSAPAKPGSLQRHQAQSAPFGFDSRSRHGLSWYKNGCGRRHGPLR
jgi:hypothetical protein